MPYGRAKYLDGIGDRMNPFLRTYKNRIYKEWAGIHHISWRAMIMADGKNISLGTFKNKEDAIRARLEGERLYWGGDAI